MVDPRISWIPKSGSRKFGKDAVRWLRETAGMQLDDWQAFVLEGALRGTPETWDTAHVGLNVARQNGKGEIVVARMLVELYLVASPLTIYSAHNFDTALEHFRRITDIIEDEPELYKQLVGRRGSRPYGITFGKGNEGVELRDGRRIRFRTRTAGGGRGFSCDCLILDEAMFLPEFTLGALLPVISARKNPQVWYVGSAVDQMVHDHGVAFTRVRERALKEEDPDLCYFEWSLPYDHPDAVPDEVLADPLAFMPANPAMPDRIRPEYVVSELLALDRRTAAVERGGVGDPPSTEKAQANPIDMQTWHSLANVRSTLQNPVCIAFDVSPDRQSSISCAGRNQHGVFHVEVAESGGGTAWVPDRLRQIAKAGQATVVRCAGRSPAEVLVPDIEELGLSVEVVSVSDHGQACARLVDAVEEARFVHMGQELLTNALKGAHTRPLGDTWVWSRRDSSVNISPLVSTTLALSAAMVEKPRKVMVAW